MLAPLVVVVAALLACSVNAFTFLVSQLTLDEKIGIVTGDGQLNPQRRCIRETHAVPRLGIPSLCFNDGPAGVRLVKNVTGFPAGINAASTFSRRLMRARGQAMAEEFRGKGINVLLGPAMDIMRNPKAGRGWERRARHLIVWIFGPDPYLNGEGAYDTIMGIQSTGVMACAKHLIANNQEHWRYGLSADVDDRTLHEMYWYPFLRSIEANVTSVMCAYNRFNQTSSCHHAGLLGPSGLLQKNGFKGFVVSDWGATHDTASDNANAGLDMEQPGDYILIGGGVYGGNLLLAVQSGAVSTDRLNEMVTHILASWYRLGQDMDFPAVNFNSQAPDGTGSLNQNVNVRSDGHTSLVREIASASAVLLKNNRSTTPDGVTTRGLPIATQMIKNVAVIGQDAKLPSLNCPGGLNECNDGTMVIGWGSGSNSLDFVVPPIDSITSFFGSSVSVTTSLSNDLSAGPAAAKGKDVAFVFVNAMSGELGLYDTVVGNMGDRNDLDLWFKGGSLVENVAAVCNNTIVVIHSVGPVNIPWNLHPNITAIIYAGAPGEQTGPSLVDVISGQYNPRGRLPFSIANDEKDFGTSIVYLSLGFPTLVYSEKLLLDYRYMDANDITPRFEFGFGLSYTSFEYSDLSITTSSDPSSAASVSFTIKNTGGFDGTEIPQLYLTYPANAGEPKKVLRGFNEVDIPKGQSKRVVLNLSLRDLSIWDTVNQKWARPSGVFTILVGASSKDIRLSGSL
ncbi:glycoside hydrolase family 3 protein [Amanita thiersii Skay4041]|uniref:beta-glucosidase n=1 Tax=Amanita thiersii Skay4041 TaxID=703135 RepID=A0A2A9NSF5_9AGAR|nr:glycoside hydrolase family 3 protein [Amanita thiersii Skay4041]